MVQTKSYEYYRHRERPYLPTKRLREGDVRNTESIMTQETVRHSSGQETGFYPWFQMPCGTSGTAVKSQSISFEAPGVIVLKVLLKGNFISVFFNDLLILSFTSNVNISSAEHGLITNTTSEARLSCQSFKILLR